MRWSPIPQTLGAYEVSERGDIRRIRDGFVPKINCHGRCTVSLRSGRMEVYPAREACLAFHHRAHESCRFCYPSPNADHFWRGVRPRPHNAERLKAAHQRYVGKGTSR